MRGAVTELNRGLFFPEVTWDLPAQNSNLCIKLQASSTTTLTWWSYRCMKKCAHPYAQHRNLHTYTNYTHTHTHTCGRVCSCTQSCWSLLKSDFSKHFELLVVRGNTVHACWQTHKPLQVSTVVCLCCLHLPVDSVGGWVVNAMYCKSIVLCKRRFKSDLSH